MDIDQIEMMMMQMDKLPELFGAFNDIPEMGSAMLPPQMFDNAAHHFSSPPALTNQHPQSTISFSNMAPVHDASRWRGNNGEMLNNGTSSQKRNSMAAMREMIFRIAAMQPIHIDPESVKPPKRRNVKISKDPQSVAARHRRERISERIRILQRLVPGGTKMDTASMLDEAIHYVKFLKNQVQSLERAASANNHHRPTAAAAGLGFPIAVSAGGSYLPKVYQPAAQPQNVQHYGDA